MKKYTHPLKNKSIIQWKDGSTHVKYWLFYKSVLYLENNAGLKINHIEKLQEKVKSKQIQVQYSKEILDYCNKNKL